jgi:hypothetical protein
MIDSMTSLTNNTTSDQQQQQQVNQNQNTNPNPNQINQIHQIYEEASSNSIIVQREITLTDNNNVSSNISVDMVSNLKGIANAVILADTERERRNEKGTLILLLHYYYYY